MPMPNHKIALLAALLHEVGYLVSQTSKGPVVSTTLEASLAFVRSHADCLSRYVSVDDLITVMRTAFDSGQPNMSELPTELQATCSLLRQADRYSFPDHQPRYQKTSPEGALLASVFCRLSLTGTTAPLQASYRPVLLSPAGAFPHQGSDSPGKDLEQLRQEFATASRRLFSSRPVDFDTFVTRLLTLLESYAWSVPAETGAPNPDTSLYDHLRTTCAIAAALHQFHSHQPSGQITPAEDASDRFRLIVGDLSGIQRYIFDIASVGAGGVAKRLRSRSFFVSAVTTGAAQLIVKKLGLPQACILLLSGGKFYILAPNLGSTEDVLLECQSVINNDLLERYGGEIALNLASITVAGEEFSDYAAVTHRLSDQLAQTKQTPYKSMLQSNDRWAVERFVLPQVPGSQRGYCRACGKLPATATHHDANICWLCERDLDLGRWLPRAHYIAYYTEEPSQDKEVAELPGGLWVTVTGQPPRSPSPMVVYALERSGLEGITDQPARLLHIASHTPIDSAGGVMDFEEIAAQSRGKALLGYVKADVDNLGALFAIGMGRAGTIARIGTLSRMMEIFFSGWVKQRITKDFPSMYVVYAGGDDLLAIGPWDQSIQMISAIREDFRRFVAGNPEVTLSASVTLSKPSRPVAQTVDIADESLDAAKNQPARRYECGRDQINLMGDLIKWHDLGSILGQAEQLAAWMEQPRLRVSSGFVHRLLHYASLFDRYLDGYMEGLKYLPLLSYDLARNLTSQDQHGVRRWAEGLKDINGDSIHHLAVVARYALLRRRGSGA